jgi:hypothetical protein
MTPEQGTLEPTVEPKRPRGKPFVKGQPRPQGSGRQKGTKGKVSTEIREFFRGLLDGEGFRDSVRQRFESGKVLDQPHVLAVVMAHAIGKPVPQQPAEDNRPPLLFITQHSLGSYDPLAAKAAELAARKAARALPEGKADAYVPPSEAKSGDPEPELVVIDPGSLAGQMMARPK